MYKTNIKSALLVILTGIIGSYFLVEYVGIPNFEIITSLTLVSATFLGGLWALLVPFSIIAGKDLLVGGNGAILFFTWSAFAIIGLAGLSFNRLKMQNNVLKIVGLTGLGIGSSIFFFLYTNFGWWMVSNMYPHTLDGLIRAYVMGLPFFKNNLMGNLIFVPMASGAAIILTSGIKVKMWNLKRALSVK